MIMGNGSCQDPGSQKTWFIGGRPDMSCSFKVPAKPLSKQSAWGPLHGLRGADGGPSVGHSCTQ